MSGSIATDILSMVELTKEFSGDCIKKSLIGRHGLQQQASLIGLEKAQKINCNKASVQWLAKGREIQLRHYFRIMASTRDDLLRRLCWLGKFLESCRSL